MRVLLDTNVVLDVLLCRGQWLAEAQRIWRACAAGELLVTVTASAMTDVYYVSRRLVGQQRARYVVRECLDTLTILPVDHAILDAAFVLAGGDFEDDVQIAAAQANGLDAIVTRDAGGFGGCPIPVFSPAQLIARLPPSA
jgi:predicted nucleic acid-binding protein